MDRRPAPAPGIDALQLAFRIRTVKTGLWPSFASCAFVAVYYLMTFESGSHRMLLLSIAGLSLAGSLAMYRLPLERIVTGRWREAFFAAWSCSLIAIIAASMVLDGGATSPVGAMLFLPIVFASLSYPLIPMLTVGAGAVIAYLLVAAATEPTPGAYVWMVACSLITATWVCAWQARHHENQRLELDRISRSDPLTGCLNRRGFTERLEAEIARSRRHERALGIVLLDLDAFKQVNDTYGHAAGDDLLCWVVTTLGTSLRAGDALGRLGGDEFAVILGEPRDDGTETADRLVAALAPRCRVSTGTARYPEDANTLDELLSVADAALYREKRRKRKVVHTDMTARPAPAPSVPAGPLPAV